MSENLSNFNDDPRSQTAILIRGLLIGGLVVGGTIAVGYQVANFKGEHTACPTLSESDLKIASASAEFPFKGNANNPLFLQFDRYGASVIVPTAATGKAVTETVYRHILGMSITMCHSTFVPPAATTEQVFTVNPMLSTLTCAPDGYVHAEADFDFDGTTEQVAIVTDASCLPAESGLSVDQQTTIYDHTYPVAG